VQNRRKSRCVKTSIHHSNTTKHCKTYNDALSYSDVHGIIVWCLNCAQKIPMKDFAAEIRAHLDVEHFLSQAQLMLDLPETNMEQILNRMLHNLLDGEETPAAFVDASKVLFTNRSGPTRFLDFSCSFAVQSVVYKVS